jgi:hypothetical protein
MNDALSVRFVQGIRHFDRDLQSFRKGQRTLLETVP